MEVSMQGVFWRNHPKAAVTIVTLALCVVAALLTIRKTQIWYYDVYSGALREVGAYEASLFGSEAQLLRVQDRRRETKVSRDLTSQGTQMRKPPRWQIMSRHESGIFELTCATAPNPKIIWMYDTFESYFRPLLSEEEYRRLVHVALSPDKCEWANRLFSSVFLEELDRTAVASARRQLVRMRLGPVWRFIEGERPPAKG
jgi:hypothetical protein